MKILKITVIAASAFYSIQHSMDHEQVRATGGNIAKLRPLANEALKERDQARQQVVELREQAVAFSVFDGEVLAYAKCLSAHQTAGDDAAAQVAAYAPLFGGYKANALRALSGVVCKICPGDDDTQFLHDEMPVGVADQPANRTRAGFIAWINGKIDSLTIQDAVGNGVIADLDIHRVALPEDGNGPEFTRFTTGLKKTIADVANLAVQELGRKNSESPFVTDEIKRALYVLRNPGISDADLEKDLPSYFPAEYSDDLRDMLYKAIKSI